MPFESARGARLDQYGPPQEKGRGRKKEHRCKLVWQSAITSAAGGPRFLSRSRRARHVGGSMAVQFVLPA